MNTLVTVPAWVLVAHSAGYVTMFVLFIKATAK